MKDKSLLSSIKEQVNKIEIFDSHEHLLPEFERKEKEIDFFIFFIHYTSSDLISSGMQKKIWILF